MSLKIRDLVQFFSKSQDFLDSSRIFPNHLSFYGSFWDTLDLKNLLQIEGHYSLFQNTRYDGRAKLSYCLDKFFQQRKFNLKRITPTEENTAKLVQYLLFALLIQNFEEILNISIFPSETGDFLKEDKIQIAQYLNPEALRDFIEYVGTIPHSLGLVSQPFTLNERARDSSPKEKMTTGIKSLQKVRSVEIDDKSGIIKDFQKKLDKASMQNELRGEAGQLKKQVTTLCEKIDELETENQSLRSANYVSENRFASYKREKEQELAHNQKLNDELAEQQAQSDKKLREAAGKIKSLKKYKQHCYFQSFCIDNLKRKLEEAYQANQVILDKLRRYNELEHSVDRLEELEAFYKLYQHKVCPEDEDFSQRTPEPKAQQDKTLQLSSIRKRNETAADSLSFLEGIDNSILSSLQSADKKASADPISRKLLFMSTKNNSKSMQQTAVCVCAVLVFFIFLINFTLY